MIQVQELSKSFHDSKRGTRLAVDRVSFEVRAGEIFGLLGPNGAGKTTTLRLIATLLKPTGGTATLNGFDINREPGKVRGQIGFLSGDMGLYPRLTPREILDFYGQLDGMETGQRRKRIGQLLTTFEMQSFADVRTDKLSTGMKQKTSIARTLVHDPPVMIFDEPTLGLDIMTARTITTFIRECRDRGKTVIFSTHIMSEVEKLCDVIGIIHDGKLLTEGTLAQLRERCGEQDLEEIFVKVVGSLQAKAEA